MRIEFNAQLTFKKVSRRVGSKRSNKRKAGYAANDVEAKRV